MLAALFFFVLIWSPPGDGKCVLSAKETVPASPRAGNSTSGIAWHSTYDDCRGDHIG